MKKTYLDYNATAPTRPEVIDGMTAAMRAPHNASSVHSFGREGRKLVEDARQILSRIIGGPAAQIIFNSGATEGNNTVINHFKDERILVSAIEHPAVLEAAPNLTKIPVTTDGVIDLSALEELLKAEKTGLVSIMLINNETGAIQPIADASALAHKHGALFHCDAVQAIGRIPVNMAELGIDFLTLSAHKFGGPQGVGALALGLCGETPTLLHGGGQEKSARAGTENVPAIHGMGIAAKLAAENLNDYQNKTAALQKRLEDKLGKYQGVKIYSQETPRAPNTTLFSLTGASSETMMMAFDLDGIAISNGSACSSGKVEPSHVLKAMNASDAEASSALRISTGWDSREEDIDNALQSWDKIYDRMKDKLNA